MPVPRWTGGLAMIGMLALAVLLGAATLAVVGVMLHRDLAQINEQLTRSGHQPEFNRWLDQLWGDVQQLLDDHTTATDKRLRDIEGAVAQVRHHQGELARFINWMAPLVQRWSNTTPEGR